MLSKFLFSGVSFGRNKYKDLIFVTSFIANEIFQILFTKRSLIKYKYFMEILMEIRLSCWWNLHFSISVSSILTFFIQFYIWFYFYIFLFFCFKFIIRFFFFFYCSFINLRFSAFLFKSSFSSDFIIVFMYLCLSQVFEVNL